ncbi:50S ribosomal protein L11 methyltransferase [Acidomonas methanolica]|uniref:Ribosomal protein L11 methyltransferase n=1 Tax=Acidomonas methanolica NBRC 104435 TaxID=1231351 RepID=A0A023D1E0_ACIMT|nr:50S ribosomal protein L11 methyltransferase [Acidomonas methanolica]MBU2652858.1 50S ribosomal protein L11 methyltransferase [Acidomonas methanolica]TCS31262.1 ribosomal protein L11 methyltransferase [Acidomonas methanolica]GAJ27973.1 ribosomal protein L11 methyltransferase [Acidomonas methanolica NBRC 104435]GBQ48391.1 50S ribosomal protein L11 methyltransferase [Acidomonas methanolica]GEK98490.1 ribosomal protein L11 methyltransferase [Acidomonas methanolica NBRC 104435]
MSAASHHAVRRPAVRRHASGLETISVTVGDAAVPLFESALASVCTTVGIFEADDSQCVWRIEGVKDIGQGEAELERTLTLARLMTGLDAPLVRERTEAEGWLARTYEAFPEQHAGRRFAIRGTHLDRSASRARLTITLDAGIAFGSGEHGSTRGCLRALEDVAHRRPRRILDMGCGSGILAMAAAKLLRRPVLAVDIEPWSVRVTASNAAMNGLGPLIKARHGNGWSTPAVRAHAPYDLVFANILARPLCRMAEDLARHLAPGGTAILAGLLNTQARMVLAAHRRQGLVLERSYREGDWTTLVLRRRDGWRDR